MSVIHTTNIEEFKSFVNQTNQLTVLERKVPPKASSFFNKLIKINFTIFGKVHKDRTIEDIKFTGQGCAISMASASMMCQNLCGLPLKQAQVTIDSFIALLTQNSTIDSNLGKLEVFAGVRQYPQRVKCATLAWRALESLLSNNDQATITTE